MSGRKRLVLVAGGSLFVGTVVLLGGSVALGNRITDGPGIWWLPVGLVASVGYLRLWAGWAVRLLAARRPLT